jgi:hypothetical protein
MFKLGLIVTVVAIGSTQPGIQTDNCAPPDRRSAAIRYAREINTAEAIAFRQQSRYQQLDQLPLSGLSAEYTLQLSTDGASYAFSIKDKLDACHGAVFSDQVGVIYTGVPIQ